MVSSTTVWEENHSYHIYQKILYALFLDEFLNHSYFQMVYDTGSILAYFHQLMEEPIGIFSVIYYLSIYLDVNTSTRAGKTHWKIKGVRTCCCW